MSKTLLPHEIFLDPLQLFAEQLTAKYSAKSSGEPEDQLKSPVDQLFAAYGKITSRAIVLKGESTLHDRLGRPDFAAHSANLPIGYIELKAPDKGANPELFKGHDREQWKRFQYVPNLIYTDGNEWALYRNAEHTVGRIPKGKAQCTKAVSDQESKYPNEFHYDEHNKKLHVGDGVFAPVPIEVWEFEVSGLKVVQSWLGYRMRERSGKKFSPLDDIRPRTWTREFTRELLELLWVLEQTVDGYPKQKKLLDDVLDGELFKASELPEVPDEAREAPKVTRGHADQQSLNIDGES